MKYTDFTLLKHIYKIYFIILVINTASKYHVSQPITGRNESKHFTKDINVFNSSNASMKSRTIDARLILLSFEELLFYSDFCHKKKTSLKKTFY